MAETRISAGNQQMQHGVVDNTERDRRAVLNICALAEGFGDTGGQMRTEVLMALGLHSTALAMRDGGELTEPAQRILPLPDHGHKRKTDAKYFPGGRVSTGAAEEAPARVGYSRPIAHDSEGGYRAHLRRGEDPCEPCRMASNRAHAARKAAKA